MQVVRCMMYWLSVAYFAPLACLLLRTDWLADKQGSATIIRHRTAESPQEGEVCSMGTDEAEPKASANGSAPEPDAKPKRKKSERRKSFELALSRGSSQELMQANIRSLKPATSHTCQGTEMQSTCRPRQKERRR